MRLSNGLSSKNNRLSDLLNTEKKAQTLERDHSRQPVFESPHCLISTENCQGMPLKVEEDTLSQIQKIQKKFVVVSVAGRYRTGKSYLMNRLAGTQTGFPLGYTIESKTKGIWVWCRSHPTEEDTVLLLLDTEGLGDVSKGDASHDNRIFILAALLSNVLVYNMIGNFAQDDVEKLTFVTEMSKNIRFGKSLSVEDAGKELGLILPSFVLCLRDFSLELEKDGKPLTEDEYLEDCLMLKSTNDEESKKFNRPRECIRKYFPTRKCFTFDRPCDRETMKKLEDVKDTDLSKSFLEDTKKFVSYVHRCVPKVLLSSKPLNGEMFVALVKTYVAAIREGGVPDVDDAIMTVANVENERLSNEAVAEFDNELKEAELPFLKTSDFENFCQKLQNALIAKLRKEMVLDSQKHEDRAIEQMKSIWLDRKDENVKKLQEYCSLKLQDLHQKTVGQKYRKRVYNATGGYMTYKNDIQLLKKEYNSLMKDVDQYQAQEVLMKFLEQESVTENDIMYEDKKLTDKERQDELIRIQKDNELARQKQQEYFDQKMKGEMERSEKHYAELAREREEYNKREEEKMQSIMTMWDNQKAISEKQIHMMKTESENQRRQYQEEIALLTKNQQKLNRENTRRFEETIKLMQANANERERSMKEESQRRSDEMKQMFSETNYWKGQCESERKKYDDEHNRYQEEKNKGIWAKFKEWF